MAEEKNAGSIKEFLDRFFDLCKDYQEKIPPHKMAEIFRDYADRLDWMSELLKSENNPSFVGNLVPTIANYQKLITKYKTGITMGDFYEEPIGEDFVYPDWW